MILLFPPLRNNTDPNITGINPAIGGGGLDVTSTAYLKREFGGIFRVQFEKWMANGTC